MNPVLPHIEQALTDFEQRGGQWYPELAQPLTTRAQKLALALRAVGNEVAVAYAQQLEQSIQLASTPQGVINLAGVVDAQLPGIAEELTEEQETQLDGLLQAAVVEFAQTLQGALEAPDMGEFPPEPVEPPDMGEFPPDVVTPSQPAPSPSQRPPTRTPTTQQPPPGKPKLMSKGAIIGLAIGVPLFLGAVVLLSRFGSDGGRDSTTYVVLDENGNPLKGAAAKNKLKKLGYA